MDYPISVPGVGLVAGKFTDGNPSLGQPASLDPSAWANNVTDELLTVIRAAGLVPSESKSDQLLSAIRALSGSYLNKSVAGGASVTLSAVESDNAVIWFSGALTANITVIMPAVERRWIIGNFTTGNYALTVKTASGTGVAASQGACTTLFCNGTSVYEARPVLRSFDGSGVGVSAAVNLSVAQAGSWFSVGADVPVTLPSADLAQGLVYLFRADSAFTLTSAAGNVGGAASLNIAQGEWVEVTGNLVAGGGWYITGRGLLARATSYADSQIFSALCAPAGLIAAFPFTTVPPGWLKANGAAISRTTYAGLFAQIGTAFGVGNGSTTFNVPDLRGEFLRGFDDGRGVDTGRGCGTWQADEFKSHTHRLQYGSTAGANLGSPGYTTAGSLSSTGIEATGGTETRPRNFAALFCIKY